MLLLSILTCVAIMLVIYHHLVYPALLNWWAGQDRRPLRRSQVKQRRYHTDPADQRLPQIELIIPAYNEAAYIADKIANLACLDYPAERLTITIACDGCTDATAAEARRAIGQLALCEFQFNVVEHKVNRGKVALLNQHISASPAAIIALSDVSALLSVDALMVAAARFVEADVGVVCGYYHLLNPGSEGEARYWQYQRKVKRAEAQVGAPLGAHGAFYLFRKACFSELPPDTINDDFVLPMTIVAKGYRAVYEPRIRALELEQADDAQDRQRRVRIGAGNMQQLIRLKRLCSLRYGGVAFAFISGKALRVLMPLLMLWAWLGSLLLAGESLWWLAVALMQTSLYAAAMLPRCAGCFKRSTKLRTLNYLVEGHFTSLWGAFGFLRQHLRSLRRPEFLSHKVLACKRAFDLSVALIALPLLLPLFPVIALLIKLDSPGPVFYRQLRVGALHADRTELFYMVKFRTMRTDAEKQGAAWATQGDTRVTRCGRFLRKTRLDELPQLWNVIRGEMSLVGPRPERPVFYSQLERAIPFFAERTFGLKPGITGLAQVNQGYDTCIDDVRSKVGFDHSYALALVSVSSWLRMELSVVLRTFTVMILGRGQ